MQNSAGEACVVQRGLQHVAEMIQMVKSQVTQLLTVAMKVDPAVGSI